MKRCGWAKTENEIKYHDTHWCRVKHDDDQIFEMLILEGLQAGLSWRLILDRWEGLKEALDHFDYSIIAQYDEHKKEFLLTHPAMIKNKRKINAIIVNAQCFIKVQKEFGSFDQYIWSFIDHTPIINHWQDLSEVPSFTPLSIKISKDLKQRGFKFVGETIIYSFMQSIGMINDHLVDCPCFKECHDKS